MAEKRTHDSESSRPAKKVKKGFQIGPANLPDGTHKRKGKHPLFTGTFMRLNADTLQ